MRLDCTCAFSVYFSKSEMWIMPNMGPNHGQPDLDWQTLELEARFLDLFNSSYNLLFINLSNTNSNRFQGLILGMH